MWMDWVKYIAYIDLSKRVFYRADRLIFFIKIETYYSLGFIFLFNFY